MRRLLARLAARPFAEFSPDVRRALRVDVAATGLLTVFTCLTSPFTGLILRRDLGASSLQLALVPTAGAVCLLLSLLWARLMAGRAPLPCVESLTHTGLDVVWMMAVIDVAGPRRITHYMAISGTLAGVRGVVGPLAGALPISHFGVHAVYLVAAGVMGCVAVLLSRDLRADALRATSPAAA